MRTITSRSNDTSEARKLRALVDDARTRLAELETAYTVEKAKVDGVQAGLFKILRIHNQERDRLRVIVGYRREFIKALLGGSQESVERVKKDCKEAEARTEREYEETAQTLAAKKDITASEQAELSKLWKNLVKLYHPDRFAQESSKLETYGALTAAINRAKDTGDMDTLRAIANDPHGFILKMGWTNLDFHDEDQLARLEKLLKGLEKEISAVLECHEQLHKSPEYELYQMVTHMPEMLDTIAAKQTALLEKEIVELKEEAERLAIEIGRLTAPGIV